MNTAFAPAPPAAVTRVLATFSRDELAAFVTVAIDLLDFAAGNPDIEANGDELDGSNAEDEECGLRSDGPGCPFSDPPEEDDEDRGLDDGEPDYRRLPLQNRKWAGPGCTISDSDLGAEDVGEPELGCQRPAYAIDQSQGPQSPYAN